MGPDTTDPRCRLGCEPPPWSGIGRFSSSVWTDPLRAQARLGRFQTKPLNRGSHRPIFNQQAKRWKGGRRDMMFPNTENASLKGRRKRSH